MSDIAKRVCIGCGDSEDVARLEVCGMCRRDFCSDCAFRTPFGRRFCSAECGRAYYFAEESDDESAETDD